MRLRDQCKCENQYIMCFIIYENKNNFEIIQKQDESVVKK